MKRTLLCTFFALCACLSIFSQSIFPAADKVYTINRNGNQSAFMYQDGATIGAASYSNSRACFWRFVPTENEKCFYIQNVATGSYVQSTKLTLSALVAMGSTPVEFRVDTDNTVGAATNGYYYLCSTDQTNISVATDGTLGLNFGANGVCAYYIKSGRGNSYWEIKETEEEMDITPFETVENLGDLPTYTYTIATQDGQVVTPREGVVALSGATYEVDQSWYFVGTSNKEGGYLIANQAQPMHTLNWEESQLQFSQHEVPTAWYLRKGVDDQAHLYTFVPYALKENPEAPLFTVDGHSHFLFRRNRSTYAKEIGVYSLPCGAKGDEYLTSMTLQGGSVQKCITYTATAAPSSYYTIYTSQKATVTQGESFDLTLSFSQANEYLNIIAYFDWDGDGIFETSYAYQNVAEVTETIEVPATALLGAVRMRLRATLNGLSDAEDEVHGYLYDFVINVAPSSQLRTVQVNSSSATRGTVMLQTEEGSVVPEGRIESVYGQKFTAIATPLEEISFVCWKEADRVVSTEPTYTFSVDQHIDLIAYFSPNPTEITAIEATHNQQAIVYSVEANAKQLTVTCDVPIRHVVVYNTKGELVAYASQPTIQLNGISQGIYIIKVMTAQGDVAKKIAIQQ